MQCNIKKIIPGLLIGIILLLVIIYYSSNQEDNNINENNTNQEEKIEDQNKSENNENSDQEQKIEENENENENENVKEEEILNEDEIITEPEIIPIPTKPEEKPKYEKDSKEDLEQRLNEAKEKDDYQSFANALGVMYEKGWETNESLVKIESEMYVKGTGYFDNSEIDKAYEMADIIYNKAF